MSKIERVTLHEVHDDVDSYQVQVLHLGDGQTVGYRVDACEDEDGREVFEFSPVQDGILTALIAP